MLGLQVQPPKPHRAGLVPAEQERVSVLWWAPAWEFLPVHPRPGTHVLHPFLRDILHDPDPQKVQVQPLFPYQGKLTLPLGGDL